MSEQPQEQWALEAAREIVAMPMINEHLTNEVAEIIQRHSEATRSEQPQEWTYEYVKSLLLPNFGVEKIRAVMEAHNAALAAERAKVKVLVDALESIAANTCCDKCQEAALVAKDALAKVKEAK